MAPSFQLHDRNVSVYLSIDLMPRHGHMYVHTVYRTVVRSSSDDLPCQPNQDLQRHHDVMHVAVTQQKQNREESCWPVVATRSTVTGTLRSY